MRGNPWSNVSSQYPTPPKPPTSARKSNPPPPSSGAERYRKNFQPPPTSAYQAAQEGPQARKNMYEGWENLKHGPARTGKTPQPPPRATPASGREESNVRAQRPVPPRPEASHQRSHSTSAANRKGFMPNTPGGDEPPAPRGSYFTGRDKPSVAPDLPARDAPPSAQNAGPTQNAVPDPLRQFREKAMPEMEPRLSTPYATHGGEKLNPFESANINRSKSTRERTDSSNAQYNDSNAKDPNFKSPHRARSFAERSTPRASKAYAASVDSSSDEEIRRPTRSSTYKYQPPPPQTPAQQPAQQPTQPGPKAGGPNSTGKRPSRVTMFRQWMKENPNTEPPPNGFPPDGPPLRSHQATTDANGNPSMYENSSFFSPDPWFITPKKSSSFENGLPTVAEQSSSPSFAASRPEPARTASMKLPSFLTRPQPTTPPSGVATDPSDLNAFETLQRNVVDGLLSNKKASSSGGPPQSCQPTGLSSTRYNNQGQQVNFDGPPPAYQKSRIPMASMRLKKENSRFIPFEYYHPAEAGSPSNKFKHLRDDLHDDDVADRAERFVYVGNEQ